MERYQTNPITVILKTIFACIVVYFAVALNIGLAKKPKKNAEKDSVEYVFTVEKEIPHTPIKNQANSGTCWSFSGISFFESEILRNGSKDTFDLSEMWIVRNAYYDKVEKYVRMHGSMSMSSGGSFFDVMNVWDAYGIVPATNYQGLQYGTREHNHAELDQVIAAFAKSIIESKKPTTAWRSALNGILDSYLGPKPDKLTYKQTSYTPITFAQSLGLNMDDYVSITSFTHHPFYSSFILEIPDNWAYEASYNVPLDEMLAIIDYALDNGYTVAWGADVSEKSFTRDVATIPKEKMISAVGSDQARWTGEKATVNTLQLSLEQDINQKMRQDAFDNYETTDDHGLHMIGLARDQTGKRFYKVKNSWGTRGQYSGYLFVSVPFVRYKTINIMVNKKAIPPSILSKMNLH